MITPKIISNQDFDKITITNNLVFKNENISIQEMESHLESCDFGIYFNSSRSLIPIGCIKSDNTFEIINASFTLDSVLSQNRYDLIKLIKNNLKIKNNVETFLKKTGAQDNVIFEIQEKEDLIKKINLDTLQSLSQGEFEMLTKGLMEKLNNKNISLANTSIAMDSIETQSQVFKSILNNNLTFFDMVQYIRDPVKQMFLIQELEQYNMKYYNLINESFLKLNSDSVSISAKFNYILVNKQIAEVLDYFMCFFFN